MSAADPDANFANFVPFKVTYLPGKYVIQALDPPLNFLALDSCGLPTRYFGNYQSLWDGYAINWSLCDYNQSFGVSGSPIPDYPTLCTLLQSNRVAGPCENSMSGVATVNNSSDPGVGLKDTTNSTATDIYIKRLASATSALTLTDNATNVTFDLTLPNPDDINFQVADTTGAGGNNIQTVTNADRTSGLAASPGLSQFFSDTETQILCNRVTLPSIPNSSTSYIMYVDTTDDNKLSYGAAPSSSSPLNWSGSATSGSTRTSPATGTLVNVAVDGGYFPSLGTTMYCTAVFDGDATTTDPVEGSVQLFGTTINNVLDGILQSNGATQWTVEMTVMYISGPVASATISYTIKAFSNGTASGASLSSYCKTGTIVANLDIGGLCGVSLSARNGSTVTYTGRYMKVYIVTNYP